MLLGHCTTLFLLNEIWKPRDAVKVADATHMEIMRNVLVESSTKYTACAISLIYSELKYIEEFINCTNEDNFVNELAYELYTLRLKDFETDSDKNHAETEETSRPKFRNLKN
ncbi:unnamed protein product [Brugia timori]|uniref:Uncharacterized protein n=1 Tax=Brugia timori TaxID=42155 RepID=A0A0R3QSK1_9BILA|nr:unnamed protein product [Brugia timori]